MTTPTDPRVSPSRTHHGPEERGVFGEVRGRVEAVLYAFVRDKAAAAEAAGLSAEAAEAVETFLRAGGKRIRPQLCVLGWQAAGGTGLPDPVVRVAASLEMFHAFCLIHDDVIDHSDTRRGQPTVHRALTARHHPGRTPQAAQRVGAAAAILVGDFALAWADELLHTTRLTPAQHKRITPLIDAMRTEVIHGQYLDVTATGQAGTDVDRAQLIVRYKTAKYTCERPLHIGAALAGADDTTLDQLSAFALPLGEAFQLRDDLLGVFGHQNATGKPVLDDLREGKPTMLIAHALAAADQAQARQLRTLYGDPHLKDDTAATVRSLLHATGAHHTVEQMIHDRHTQALKALARLNAPTRARDALKALAGQAAWRTS
ncbi:polyprenyl synthetase family protein [Streptomyces sp. NPDC020379]|uniref:polyprenyl synthetase family protein n=1 Tax=Streptomyces sp. NPDC020379 TaxID=3365071 RepID=UPI00379B9439